MDTPLLIAQDPILVTYREPEPEYGSDDGTLIDPDEDREFPWLKEWNYDISLASKKIGKLTIWTINVEEIRDEFYGEMDGPSQECMEFGFDLFDENGFFKERFSREGTGVWGSEVDGGFFLTYLQHIEIEEEYRGRGIATKVLEKIWDLPQFIAPGMNKFMFAWPTPRVPNRKDLAEGEYENLTERLIRLFRSVGFRCVGTTVHFCLARDPQHPSKRIPADQDAARLTPASPAEAKTLDQAADEERTEAFMAMLKQWGVPGHT